MERKIAFSGLKGRKRDSLLLGFVVLLSFIFIVSSITFYSSFQSTKEEEMYNSFGKWHIAYLSLDDGELETIMERDGINNIGYSKILSSSDRLGIIASFDEEFLKQAHFDMYDGRMPRNSGEIAIELNQLSRFPTEMNVGDMVSVQMSIPVYTRSHASCVTEQRNRIGTIPSGTRFQTVTRFASDIQMIDDLRVETKTTYVLGFYNDSDREAELNTVEEIIEHGSIQQVSVILSKRMILSGIISNYVSSWDVDGKVMPHSYISERAYIEFIDEGLFSIPLSEYISYKPLYNVLIETDEDKDDFVINTLINTRKAHINTLAYFVGGYNTEGMMITSILAFIFIGTAIAVFQVYLSQMRRRARRIALLKSIGATNTQVAKLLSWEAMLTLVICIPLGLLIGIGIVKLILPVMEDMGGNHTIFSLNINLTLLGIIIGCIAVLLGMAIPLFKALNIPLTGEMAMSQRKKQPIKEWIITMRRKYKANKNSFLLGFVVLLSVSFVVSSLSFFVSSMETQKDENISTYGKWQYAYLNADDHESLKDMSLYSRSRLIGRSDELGLIGSFDESFMEISSLSMYEGRMPISDDEIAIELSQILENGLDIMVGDIITVKIQYPTVRSDAYGAYLEQSDRLEGRALLMLQNILSNEDSDSYKALIHRVQSYEIFRGFMDEEDFEETYNINRALIDLFSTSATRSTNDLEVMDEVRIEVKRAVSLIDLIDEFRDDDQSLVESIIEHGSIVSETVTISKQMSVSGIINDYSIYWSEGKGLLPRAYITEQNALSLIEEGALMSANFDTSSIPLRTNSYYISESDEIDQSLLAKGYIWNKEVYDDESYSAENIIMKGVVGFIFIATALAVFQIYLSQLKRRSRNIALLKSIGATNNQVVTRQIFSMLKTLIVCMPLGLAIGIMATTVGIEIANNSGSRAISFYWDIELILFGIGVSTLAVLVGMIMPLIKSMSIPLTGTISPPPKRQRSTRKIMKGINNKINTFSRITKANKRYNRGNRALNLALYTIIITVLIASIHITFINFGSYRDLVLETDSPDYAFDIPVALSQRERDSLTADLESIHGLRLELYTGGLSAYLWYSSIDNNHIKNVVSELLPEEYYGNHFGTSNSYSNLDDEYGYLVEDSMIVNIYGVEANSALLDKILGEIGRGAIDQDAFNNGEQVIILSPRSLKVPYKEASNDSSLSSIFEGTDQKSRINETLNQLGGLHLSYSFKDTHTHAPNFDFYPGMDIYLTIPTENVVNLVRTNDVRLHNLKVAATIFDFEEVGLWPFSKSIETPVIIGSTTLINKLYPASVSGKGNSPMDTYEVAANTLYPTRNGRTYGYIFLDEGSRDLYRQLEIIRHTSSREIDLIELWRTNEDVRSKAIRTSSIVILLGLAIAIIVMIILFNIAISRLEGERIRIGILQALGVTKGQFRWTYLLTGIGYALVSALVGLIIIATVVILPYIASKDALIEIKNLLWLYPWKFLWYTLGIYIVLATLSYYLPINKILKSQPVENLS